MRARATVAIGVVALASAVFAAGASAVQVSPNPWLSERFLNIAHQGGEDEAPSSTLYAFKSAVSEGGADMLELDVHLTSDGHLVVIHDDTYRRTVCTDALCPGPDSSTEPTRAESQIRDVTLAELQALDAAYWFRPDTYSHDYGQPASAYPFRGIATGQKAPPAGYSAADFRIPTLAEVLAAFPHTPINIEIKMPKSQDPANPYPDDCGTADGSGPSQLCDDLDLTEPTTAALATLLNGTEKLPTAKQKRKRKRCVAKNKRARKHGGKRRKCASLKNLGRRDDIIVVSFAQAPMVDFTALAPQVHRAPGVDATVRFVTGQPLEPDGVAFQVPPISGGLEAAKLLLSPPFDVQSQGYAVHVWTNSAYDETFPGYEDMVELGADGIMTTSPRNLDAYLCQAGVPHPDGSSRCATKKPKKKKKKRKKRK